jgi:hypothetical protein
MSTAVISPRALQATEYLFLEARAGETKLAGTSANSYKPVQRKDTPVLNVSAFENTSTCTTTGSTTGTHTFSITSTNHTHFILTKFQSSSVLCDL